MYTKYIFECMILFVDFILIIHLYYDIALLNLIIAYILCKYLHTIIHEMGHLVGGFISGYALLYIKIFPIVIQKKAVGNYEICTSIESGNSCVMTPRRADASSYFIYNAGGVVFNFLFCLASGISIFFASTFHFVVLMQFVFSGIVKIAVNLIPSHSNIANDGYILKILYCSPAARNDYFNYLSLFSKIYLKIPFDITQYMYKRKMKSDGDSLMFYNALLDLIEEVKGIH